MRVSKRWCGWKWETSPTGKPTKAPIGSTRYVTSCSGLTDALRKHGQQIGFVFTGGVRVPGGTLMGLDLDSCVAADGTISDWAGEVLDWASSYTEVTVSGAGLHVWIIVRDPPKHLTRAKVNIAAPAPAGVEKQPNLQVFGYGPPQYLTCSLKPIDGLEQLNTVESLDWLIERFGLSEGDPRDFASMPTGRGTPPPPDEIEAAVRSMPHGPSLLDGHWREAVNDPSSSASEAYHELASCVLRAARGHGEAAVNFLLSRTAWGRGEIEDSRDASRYMRESWVAADVARIAAKHPVPDGSAFDDGFTGGEIDGGFDPVATAAADSDAAQPKAKQPLLLPAGEFLRSTEAAQFLAYGILPRQGLAQFFGAPGCGKTPLALSLAVHVASGAPSWLGHELERKGRVIYMIGEDHTGIRNRLLAEAALHDLDAATLDIQFSTRAAALTDTVDVALWLRAIGQDAPPDGIALLVVDTQAANFGAADENSTKDMSLFLTHLGELARRLRCLVLLVHHTGYTADGRARGSSAQPGAMDTIFEVVRTGLSVTAASMKEKNWAKPEPLRGELVVLEVDVDRKQRPITAVALREAPPVVAGSAFGLLEEGAGAEGPMGAGGGGDLGGADGAEDRRVLELLRGLKGVPVAMPAVLKLLGYRGRTKALRERLERLEDIGSVGGLKPE